MRFWFIILITGFLAACGDVSGKPLPVIKDSAKTWTLTPDHLEGELPQ